MSERRARFGPIEIAYDDDVLEPRPWTIEQARWAAALLGELPDGPVLELCAGAGQIGLVVAAETGRTLVQVDVDARACSHARRNAADAGVAADVRCGDLARALEAAERFPLVLADPPYIPSAEVQGLPQDPEGAIDGGDDGLDVARTCITVAADHLGDRGLLLLQLGSADQADVLRPEAARCGLETIEVRVIPGVGALALLQLTGDAG